MKNLRYSRTYLTVIHTLSILWTLCCLFPMFFSLLSSFKNNTTIFTSPFSIPDFWTWDNYLYAFEKANIFLGMFNSFLYAGIGTFVVIALSLPVAYVLTRMRLPFSNAVMMYFIAGLTLPVHATLVPLSIKISTLGLRNSMMGIILVYIATNFSFAVFITANFIKAISYEMDEAATIDGCGTLRLLFQIITPLSMPAISTCAIITFLRIYNDLIFSVVLLDKKEMATVSIALMAFKGDQTINYGGTFAGIILAIIPLVILYIIFQSKIEQGLTEGSVKG